jgi:hypothetical protein
MTRTPTFRINRKQLATALIAWSVFDIVLWVVVGMLWATGVLQF